MLYLKKRSATKALKINKTNREAKKEEELAEQSSVEYSWLYSISQPAEQTLFVSPLQNKSFPILCTHCLLLFQFALLNFLISYFHIALSGLAKSSILSYPLREPKCPFSIIMHMTCQPQFLVNGSRSTSD